MLFFHPIQILAIAAMFCPGLWVTPPRPPDTPPISRRTVVGYKVVGGLALSQIIWFIPADRRCLPDSLCGIIHDGSLARSTLLGHSPSAPAPICRPYVSSLLKTTCPTVIIPPRPAPICRNMDMDPTFEWAPQTPAPSFTLAERSCSKSPIPIFLGDERTYVHPNISPFPAPRPTDAAPISRAFLIAAWLVYKGSLGHIVAMASVVVGVPVEFVAHRYRSWVWSQTIEGLARVKDHPYYHAVRRFSWLLACSIIGRSYHFGGVSCACLLVSSLVVVMPFFNLMWEQGVIPSIAQKMWKSLIKLYRNLASQVIGIYTFYTMLNVQAPVVDGVEDNYIIPAVPMPTVLSSPPPTFIPVASFPELVAEASLSHIDEVISPSTDVRDVNEEMLTESGSTHAVATSDQARDRVTQVQMVNSGEHGVIASMVLSPTISPSPPPTATATLLIASPPEFMEPSTTVIDEVGSPAIDDLEELLASSGATSSLVIPSSDEAQASIFDGTLADSGATTTVTTTPPDVPEPRRASMPAQVQMPEPELPFATLGIELAHDDAIPILSIYPSTAPGDTPPGAANPESDGTPRRPPYSISPSTSASTSSTSGESPVRSPRVRRRIRRSIRREMRALREATGLSRMSTIQASTSATAAGTVTIGASINTTTSPSRSQSSLRQARRPPSNRSAPVARSSTSTARRNPDPRARQSPPQFAPVASSRTMRQTLEPRARVLWNSESRTRPQQSRQSPLESAPVASSSTAQQTPGRFPHWDRWLGRRPTSRR